MHAPDGNGPPGAANERRFAVGLACGRLAIGTGLWLAPRLSARALGFDDPDPRLLAIGRLAATRDLALGALTLRSLDDPQRLRGAIGLSAAVDAGDALTFLLALGGDAQARRAGARGLPLALGAALAGAWLARRA